MGRGRGRGGTRARARARDRVRVGVRVRVRLRVKVRVRVRVSAPELSSGRFQNCAWCLAMCATVRITPLSSSLGHSSAPGTQRSSRSTPSVFSPVAWVRASGRDGVGLGLGLGVGVGLG